MTYQQTPFEINETWTPLAWEQAYLEDLNDTTDLDVSVIGHSVKNRPIFMCSIGNGPILFLISLQHGTAAATREASLQLVRNLAYRTESWMQDYIDNHRLIVVPTMCPDNRYYGQINNQNGVDTNRDWLQYTQPETHATATQIALLDPDVVYDARETGGDINIQDWIPLSGGYPGSYPPLTVLGNEYIDQFADDLAVDGLVTNRYSMTLASWASCNVYQVAAGRVGLLGATMVAQPRPKRVTISYRSFVSLLKWHRANSDRIRQARAEVQAWQLSQTAPIKRPWREYVGLVAAPTTEAIGYKTDPLPRDLAQIHGIEIVDGIASTKQKVRPLVVAVMDPDSFYKSVDGIPIFKDLKLAWHETGDKQYELGVDKGVFYPLNATTSAYDKAYAWNGLISVTESPSGAEVTKNYADNDVYMSLMSAEEFAATVEAYNYPDEFALVDGTAEPVPGLYVGQQPRKPFGLSYRTKVGNDSKGMDAGYKIHLIYNAMAAPSEKAYSTVNDSPEATTFSWELSTTPINAGDVLKSTAQLTINSLKVPAAKLKALEDILYGTTTLGARLPLPTEVIGLLSAP